MINTIASLALFEQTGGMFPELVTRPDLEVFLPPIGGMSVYIMGDPSRLGRPETRIACRVHDECNGSDVFGLISAPAARIWHIAWKWVWRPRSEAVWALSFITARKVVRSAR